MKELIQSKLRYWYAPLILGLVFIGLGVLVFSTPVATFLTIAVLFSIGFVVSGVIEVFYAISNRKELKNWGWYLAGGILTFILGTHLALRPDLSALLLSLYIGFWLLFRSVMYITTSIELRDTGSDKWGWVLVLGILGVLFSFILIWNPLLAGATFVFWLGFGLIVLGLINILLSFAFKKVKSKVEKVIDDFEERADRYFDKA